MLNISRKKMDCTVRNHLLTAFIHIISWGHKLHRFDVTALVFDSKPKYSQYLLEYTVVIEG